jgi:hypothetical protein
MNYFILYSNALRFSPFAWGIISTLGVAGMVLAIQKRKMVGPLWPLLSMVAAIVIPMVLLTSVTRYRAPLAALLLPFAAFTCESVVGWIQNRNWRALCILTTTSAVFLLSLNGVPRTPHDIRAADYLAPVQLYYYPLYREAMDARQFARAVAVCNDMLRIEPEFLHELSVQRRPRDADELVLVQAYCDFHGLRLSALEQAGMPELASSERMLIAKLQVAADVH